MWLGRLATTIRGDAAPAPRRCRSRHVAGAKLWRACSICGRTVANVERRPIRSPAPTDAPSSRDASPPTTKSAHDAEGAVARRRSGQQPFVEPVDEQHRHAVQPADAVAAAGRGAAAGSAETVDDSAEEARLYESSAAGVVCHVRTGHVEVVEQRQDRDSRDRSRPTAPARTRTTGRIEAGIQDEVEEEKTAGVERPSLRKNKPPVDRNLSPRPDGRSAESECQRPQRTGRPQEDARRAVDDSRRARRPIAFRA